MVESIMFAALGFLSASLLALIILPLVHARAVRLTRRRVQASIPVSMAEIQADKDQLRAEFAMASRRLEMRLDEAQAKHADHLVELGRRTEEISRLKTELGALQAELRAAKEAGAPSPAAPQAAGGDAATSMMNDSQRVEIVALKTQNSTLQDRVQELERELQRSRKNAAQLRSERDAAQGAQTQTPAEAAGAGTQHQQAVDALTAENRRLQAELATLKEAAENAAAAQADEAALRERINDVSAEVARLAAALDGPDSPITALVAEAQRAEAEQGQPAGASGGRTSLAARVRMLQSRTAREPAVS